MDSFKQRIRRAAEAHQSNESSAWDELKLRRQSLVQRRNVQKDIWRGSGPHAHVYESEFARLQDQCVRTLNHLGSLLKSHTAALQEVTPPDAILRTLARLLTPKRRNAFKEQLREISHRRSTEFLPAQEDSLDQIEIAVTALEALVTNHKSAHMVDCPKT